MTAVALPDLDLTRFRSALDDLDLPWLDPRHLDLAPLRAALERLDLADVDPRHLDLAPLRAALERLDLADVDPRHLDLARIRAAFEELDLTHVDLPHVDLPTVDRVSAELRELFPGRRRRGFLWSPGAPVAVGIAALLGGMLVGGALAWLFHPGKGPERRAAVRRRLGRLKRRVLGTR
jgi:hypothetical protein